MSGWTGYAVLRSVDGQTWEPFRELPEGMRRAFNFEFKSLAAKNAVTRYAEPLGWNPVGEQLCVARDEDDAYRMINWLQGGTGRLPGDEE